MDLGQKVGTLDFGGVFRFGLRTKSWNFGFWEGIPGTSDLDLGQRVGTLDFGGGIPVTSYLDSLTFFILGGILVTSYLDSLTFFIWGGILGSSDGI